MSVDWEGQKGWPDLLSETEASPPPQSFEAQMYAHRVFDFMKKPCAHRWTGCAHRQIVIFTHASLAGCLPFLHIDVLSPCLCEDCLREKRLHRNSNRRDDFIDQNRKTFKGPWCGEAPAQNHWNECAHRRLPATPRRRRSTPLATPSSPRGFAA